MSPTPFELNVVRRHPSEHAMPNEKHAERLTNAMWGTLHWNGTFSRVNAPVRRADAETQRRHQGGVRSGAAAVARLRSQFAFHISLR